MALPRITRWTATLALSVTSACGDDALEALRRDAESDVGKPCATHDEADPEFRGFAITEVSVETGASDCMSRVCLVNHFKGRASRPYGQSDPKNPTCLLPGTSDPVLVRVEPQDSLRPADLAVA